MGREFVYAVVVRQESGKHSDGGMIRRRRRLRDGERLEHDGAQWRVDHIVDALEPPLVYLVGDDAA